MTLIKGPTLQLGLVAALLVTAVCAAAERGHPDVAAETGCVTAQCHARLLGAAGVRDGSVHQPASGGDCSSCHDLALSPAVRFVRGAPDGSAAGVERGRAWDVALCSGCHGEGLLAADAPPGSTGFTDGKRNLHALHVQAGRGRRCLVCHEPHAARQPRLLREWIPARGSAKITQQFRAEAQGGRCKTGCHAPKSYRR